MAVIKTKNRLTEKNRWSSSMPVNRQDITMVKNPRPNINHNPKSGSYFVPYTDMAAVARLPKIVAVMAVAPKISALFMCVCFYLYNGTKLKRFHNFVTFF